MSERLIHIRIAFVLMVILAILMAACAIATPEATDAPPAPEPTEAPAPTEAPEPTEEPMEEGPPDLSGEPFPTGTFKWMTSKFYEFFDDGTWTWGRAQDEPMLRGEYTVEGDIVTFHSESMFDGSVGGCGTNEGTYAWAFVDNVLSFEKIDDTCRPRISDNDGKDYVLIEE